MDPVYPSGSSFLSETDDSEMRRRIAEFDWHKTPLGPINDWPPTLQLALRICLGSSFPLAIYWGPEFTLLYNDACSGLAGKRHPWVLGRPASEAWFDLWDIISPDYYQAFSGLAARRDEQLLPISRYGYTEECYFDYTLSPIRSEDGEVAGLFSTMVETTGRIIGERRLRTLRDLGVVPAGDASSVEHACESAASVLATNPYDLPLVLLYLLDAEKQRATLAGAAGIPRGTQISPRLINLNDPDAPWPFAGVVQTQRSAKVDGLRERFGMVGIGPWPEPIDQAVVMPLAKPGQKRLAGFVVAGVSPRRLFDDDYRGFFELVAGQVATSVAHVRAFEEEHRRAEALAELDQAKTNFFNNISHEFRTPLTLMLSPVEDLLAKPQGEVRSENRELLTVVNRNGRRLLRLVNTLLDFSRIEAGRATAVYQPTALAAFTRDVCSVFRSVCERASLRLIVDCPTLAEPVYVDRDMWEKIVLNLLSNAFKFTFEGEIAITLRQVARSVQLKVGDMGTGIPAEEMPKVFERFHRIDNAHGRTHEGSGIGLALVQELVKLHGGTITAESVVGRGSTFTVTLPLGSDHLPADRIRETSTAATIGSGLESYADESLRWLPDPAPSGNFATLEEPEFADEVSSENASSGSSSEGSGNRRFRILIADDNTDLRQYLVRLLSERYDVRAVSDGEQAFVVAQSWKPDLLLADVMMPRLDGFALLRKLRGNPAIADLPVIMLSARAGEESRMEGLEAGADDYLVKPFSARELLARVGGTLQMARLRHEADASVRSSEERLRMALTAARMVAWEWDLADNTVKLSENAAEMFDLSPSSAIKTHQQQFALIHPDDLERHQAIVNQAVQNCASYLSHFRIIRPRRGDFIWIEERADTVCDPSGRALRLVGVAMDVSERKQIEETLQRSHARFESLVNRSPVGIFLVDDELQIRQVNPQARPIFGEFDPLTDSDFVKIMHTLWPRRYADEVIEVFRHTLHSGEPGFIPERPEFSENRYLSPHSQPDSAKLEHYEWQIDRISLQDGRHGVVCYINDVSRHVLVRQALAENDRRKDEFLATLAHELRNPLAPIRTGLELLRMASDNPALVEDVRLKMEGQTRQLVRLVDDLLDVSRINCGKVVLKKERIELQSVVRSALDATRLYFEECGHTLSIELPPQPIYLDADAARLAQIISNLLTNAARYTDRSGHIEVIAEQQGSEAVVTVKDNGIGIAADMLVNIFEMFTQADHSVERSSNGLGIGLTLVRRLVELHGGSVEARSEGPGHGSAFSVRLPISNQPLPQLQPASDDVDVVSTSVELAKLRILVVDDNQDAANMLATAVKMLGSDARVAYDGLEALDIAEQFQPDVVLMDLGMPKLNGYDTARRMRQRWPDQLKIVALTGWGQDEDRRHAFEAGFDHHMVKPVEPAALWEVLSNCQPRSPQDNSST
jgi:PAS domain S-box-containing protein